MRRFAYLIFATMLCASFANATIIAVLNSGPTLISPGDYAFNYRADLSGDERVDASATATPANGCATPNLSNALCDPFFTIYDIQGYLGASESAPGWVTQSQLVGITPSSFGTGFDNPGLVNVTYYYTGPVVHGNGTTVSFNGFQIQSSLGSTQSGTFTSQSTKDTGDQNGLTDQTIGPVTVPAAPLSTVPEPATTLLVGGSLLGVGLAGRRLRRNRS